IRIAVSEKTDLIRSQLPISQKPKNIYSSVLCNNVISSNIDNNSASSSSVCDLSSTAVQSCKDEKTIISENAKCVILEPSVSYGDSCESTKILNAETIDSAVNKSSINCPLTGKRNAVTISNNSNNIISGENTVVNLVSTVQNNKNTHLTTDITNGKTV